MQTQFTVSVKQLIYNKVVQLICKIYSIKAHNKKDKTPISKIATYSDITYSHTIRILKLLIKEGLIERHTIDKRSSTVVLTDKGNKVALRLIEIGEILSIGEKN